MFLSQFKIDELTERHLPRIYAKVKGMTLQERMNYAEKIKLRMEKGLPITEEEALWAPVYLVDCLGEWETLKELIRSVTQPAGSRS